MLGKTIVHPDQQCPTRASLWCSQCSCHGHLPSLCTESLHVWRPVTLEELIPSDVRERWGITTQTRIIWSTDKTCDIVEREISNSNIIEIRHKEGVAPDKRIREVMKQNKIQTSHKMVDNIQLLRNWAISQGKKVRIIQEPVDNGA